MPIYEYECTTCRTVLEVFQRMTEDPLTTCPDCSGPVKKLVSMSSFKLKGGGWYADGYSSASCNSSGTAAADTSAKSSPEKAEKKAGSSTASTSAAKNNESCAFYIFVLRTNSKKHGKK
ncbi:MAG: zinc ribbon domain-containing protein [Deltaproteobacteria bacterium]|jgi:putative FmdB family regulatory protein|nr:zinc ribbon domain-containing protein [Deltaproteobacteria bacterium]